MELKNIEKHFTDLGKIHDQKNSAFSDWLKNIVSIAVGLLAILVSLKSNKSCSLLEHYLFSISILNLTLGILLGVVVLYSNIKIYKLLLLKKEQQIDKLLDGENFAFDSVSLPKFYKYLEYICYFSFSISLISISVYAILSDY